VLSPVNQIGWKIGGSVPAIGTYAFVAGARKFGLRRLRQPRHSHLADFRFFKFGLALRANNNPLGHLSPQRGDSQGAGEHLLYVTVPDCHNTHNWDFHVDDQ
jgi:hypothetical protein